MNDILIPLDDQVPPARFRCAGCDCQRTAGGAVIAGPAGRTAWVCVACAALAQRSPAWRFGCEMAAVTGIAHSNVVKVFARLGLEPPAGPLGVAEAVHHVMGRGA